LLIIIRISDIYCLGRFIQLFYGFSNIMKLISVIALILWYVLSGNSIFAGDSTIHVLSPKVISAEPVIK